MEGEPYKNIYKLNKSYNSPYIYKPYNPYNLIKVSSSWMKVIQLYGLYDIFRFIGPSYAP